MDYVGDCEGEKRASQKAQILSLAKKRRCIHVISVQRFIRLGWDAARELLEELCDEGLLIKKTEDGHEEYYCK